MAHEFLSPQWLDAAQQIRESLGDVGPSPVELVMNLNITEVPFSADGLRANLDTRVGPLALAEGHASDPHLTVTITWITAKALLIDGQPQAAMSAFMAGKIKVEGDMAKLVALQNQKPDPRAEDVLAQLRAITA
jgi:hypothetical protein